MVFVKDFIIPTLCLLHAAGIAAKLDTKFKILGNYCKTTCISSSLAINWQPHLNICVWFACSQWKASRPGLSKAEAGGGEGLRVWQAAQVQRATEREQLSLQRHCCQERRRVHTHPAFKPNNRQQCSHTRGELKSTHYPSFVSIWAFARMYILSHGKMYWAFLFIRKFLI